MNNTTRKHWRSRYPTDSFDPRWPLLLKKAVLAPAARPLEIHFQTPREAASFQQRIYSFRGKCREENHPDWKLFMRVCVSRTASTLRLFAQDSQFEDAFSQAGLEDPDRPSLREGEDILDDPDLAHLLADPGTKDPSP